MGKTVPTTDYVIAFTASWKTLEDTLLFFDNDLQEARLREPAPPAGLGRAIGVHASQWSDDGSFRDHFVIRHDAIRPVHRTEPTRPAVVHLLHFGSEGEIDAHRRLARRLAAAGVALVNPYGSAAANCDSKCRMAELLRRRGVPTPVTRFVSKFTEDRAGALANIRAEFGEMGVYVQPDRGTEAEGCVYFDARDPIDVNRPGFSAVDDLIVRPRVGNLTYQGRPFVVRVNVTYDGRSFAAESGYCLVGDEVVSAGWGAVRVDINRVLDQVRLGPAAVQQIQATTSAALRAVCGNDIPPRLAGVDLVLEQDDELVSYVIDINPRPVAVGSRRIGRDRIGLGDHFWGGIFDLQQAARRLTRSRRRGRATMVPGRTVLACGSRLKRW